MTTQADATPLTDDALTKCWGDPFSHHELLACSRRLERALRQAQAALEEWQRWQCMGRKSTPLNETEAALSAIRALESK